MKKIILSLLTLHALTAPAQSQIETFSVYDVNHDTAVTVEDVTKVVNHVVKPNADNPHTVDAAALNALLQSIDARLARIEEKLGIGGVEEEQETDDHEWVNLGLPSATLWATCNVGADSPEEFGDYFAWGEIEPKELYSWRTYIYSKGSFDSMTKYCVSDSFGTVDNKTELDLEDDAAYMNWGAGWCMPSLAQIEELYNKNYTTTIWTSRNGKEGCLITSKTNGESLFLPATGYYDVGSVLTSGSFGYYWSRSLCTSNSDCASGVCFFSGNVNKYYYGRSFGQSVRPVRASTLE